MARVLLFLPLLLSFQASHTNGDRICDGEIYELGHGYNQHFHECNKVVIERALPFKEYNWIFYACIVAKSMIGEELTPMSFATMMSRNLSSAKQQELLEYVRNHEGTIMVERVGGDSESGATRDSTTMGDMDNGIVITTATVDRALQMNEGALGSTENDSIVPHGKIIEGAPSMSTSIPMLQKSWKLYFEAEYQICGLESRFMCLNETNTDEEQQECVVEAKRRSEPHYFCSKDSNMAIPLPNIKTKVQNEECLAFWNSTFGTAKLKASPAKILEFAGAVCYMEGSGLVTRSQLTSKSSINYKNVYRKLIHGFYPPIVKQKIFAKFRLLLRTEKGVTLDQVKPFDSFGSKFEESRIFQKLEFLKKEAGYFSMEARFKALGTLLRMTPVFTMMKYVPWAQGSLCAESDMN